MIAALLTLAVISQQFPAPSKSDSVTITRPGGAGNFHLTQDIGLVKRLKLAATKPNSMSFDEFTALRESGNVDIVPNGAQATVVETKDGATRVKLKDGREGWVASEFAHADDSPLPTLVPTKQAIQVGDSVQLYIRHKDDGTLANVPIVVDNFITFQEYLVILNATDKVGFKELKAKKKVDVLPSGTMVKVIEEVLPGDPKYFHYRVRIESDGKYKGQMVRVCLGSVSHCKLIYPETKKTKKK